MCSASFIRQRTKSCYVYFYCCLNDILAIRANLSSKNRFPSEETCHNNRERGERQ
jgi:hypothetical protein